MNTLFDYAIDNFDISKDIEANLKYVNALQIPTTEFLTLGI